MKYTVKQSNSGIDGAFDVRCINKTVATFYGKDAKMNAEFAARAFNFREATREMKWVK